MIVREEWLRSAEIRKEIKIFEDEFAVMPNHVHGINWIIDVGGADGVCPADQDAPVNQVIRARNTRANDAYTKDTRGASLR